MRTAPYALALLALLAASPTQAQDRRDDRRDRDERRDDWDDRYDDRYDRDYDDGYRYGRLDIPPGHLPPPGECRVWYYDRPPGHQPPPERCGRLYGRRFPGAVVIDHQGDVVGGRSYGYYDYPDRYPRRDGDWERERVGDVLGDILFPDRRYLSEFEGATFDEGELEEALGRSAVRRALGYGREGGLDGPLTGTWIGGGVLELAVGGVPVFRLADRDGDRWADEALVRRGW